MSTTQILIDAKPVISSKSTIAGDMYERPNLTFNNLIRLALLSKPDGRATLSQIYDFIQNSYPYYKMSRECRFWKNSVRHTLCKQQQFRRLDGPLPADSKPYQHRRGNAVWELRDIGTVGSNSCRKNRPVRKKDILHQARPSSVDSLPSSVDSTCSDIYNYPYSWQLNPVEHSQSAAIDFSSTNKEILPESQGLSKETFFKPWETSPDQLKSCSHLEAPGSEEAESPPSETLDDHPLYQPSWLYGQDYCTSQGCPDPSLLVGGSWSDLVSSSSVSLPNSAHFVGYNHHQYRYTDGLFWYSM